MGVNSFKELIVYQKAHKMAMEVFELTMKFPIEEKYSLTDQIRRSSRSVSSCIAESWAKRLYPKAFINKLTDSLGEEYETEDWLDYSRDCKYISEMEYEKLVSGYNEVRKMLISMINDPGNGVLIKSHPSSPFLVPHSSLLTPFFDVRDISIILQF